MFLGAVCEQSIRHRDLTSLTHVLLDLGTAEFGMLKTPSPPAAEVLQDTGGTGSHPLLPQVVWELEAGTFRELFKSSDEGFMRASFKIWKVGNV